MVVDAIDNDVYRWGVEMAGFDVNSMLYSDLMKLSFIHGYSTVQLQVTFKRGLHPFYPPRVEVIRPRFKGPVGWAVSSHPILQLANWDPWRSQKSLLLEIKAFLQRHARVDLESVCNSLTEYPIAAYSQAEIQLARLEGLLEVRPRCASLPENKELYDSRDVKVDEARLAALTQSRQPSSDANPSKKNGGRNIYWAAGTGYGHGHNGKTKVWDAKKASAAQNAHDIETQKLLSQLSQSLATELEAKSREDPEVSLCFCIFLNFLREDAKEGHTH